MPNLDMQKYYVPYTHWYHMSNMHLYEHAYSRKPATSKQSL